MQPVYQEYIRFLKSKGCDVSWYRENTFWLDRGFIKAFERERREGPQNCDGGRFVRGSHAA